MNKISLNIRPIGLLFGLALAAGLAGCSGGAGENANHNALDAALDAGQPDGSPVDGAPSPDAVADAGDSDAGEEPASWGVATINLQFDSVSALIAAHPTSPTTLAVLTDADEFSPDFTVWHSSDGMTFVPTIIWTFTPDVGFWVQPRGLAFDPADGNNVVAAVEPFPPPTWDESVITAWSRNGGLTYDRSTYAFTNPWPPDGMRYIGGSPSELVWRAGRWFFYSGSQGEYNERTALLDPTPAGCDYVAGFDVPADNHDAVAIWCSNGAAFRCDVQTDVCQPVALTPAGQIDGLTFAPCDPNTLYLLGNNGVDDVIYRSTDGGQTATEVHVFHGTVLKVHPGDAQTACALSWMSSALHCTTDGGATWQDLTPPHLAPPGMTIVRNFTLGANGAIWALAAPGLIHHPPL